MKDPSIGSRAGHTKRPRLELGRTSESDSAPEKCTATVRPKYSSAQQDDLAKNGYISLSEQVHDIERFTPHVANAATLARILGEAADAVVNVHQDRNKPPQAAVLLLQWKEVDLGVKSEIQNLRDVFARSYGFQTETWAIPSSKAIAATAAKIDAFISTKDQNDEPVNKEGNLFIVYYGGHAYQRDHEQPTWVPNRNSPKGMRMDSIFSMFDECDADVLFLFDSCQAMPQPLDSFGKGFVSAITATGSDPNPIGIAAEVGPDSFTSSLIKVLAMMSWGPCGPQSFTESDLYNNLAREISKAPTRLEENPDGTLVFDCNGEVVPVRRKQRCPFLRPLSRNKMARPISIPILRRFGRNKKSAPLFNVDQDSFDCPASIKAADRTPEVLVSFRLTPDEMQFDDKDAWARLMLRISDAVSGQEVPVGSITTEGLFPSDSSLLLLRVPMDIWNLLRRHRSATFIGNVYGGNRAQQFEDAVRFRMLELSHTEAEKSELSVGSNSTSAKKNGKKIVGNTVTVTNQIKLPRNLP